MTPTAGSAQSDNYTYPASGAESVRPHAVTSISGGAINTTFSYDANGNQTQGLGRSISYTSFNKPSSITQGSGTLFFTYDADHQRFRQTASEGYTYYFDAFGVHAELFLGATSQWNDYLMVGGAMIGLRVLHNSDQSVSTRYFHTDNLGSIAVIPDGSGAVVERDSYDAWGNRRLPTGADGTPAPSKTTRGFTGQELGAQPSYFPPRCRAPDVVAIAICRADRAKRGKAVRGDAERQRVLLHRSAGAAIWRDHFVIGWLRNEP